MNVIFSWLTHHMSLINPSNHSSWIKWQWPRNSWSFNGWMIEIIRRIKTMVPKWYPNLQPPFLPVFIFFSSRLPRWPGSCAGFGKVEPSGCTTVDAGVGSLGFKGRGVECRHPTWSQDGVSNGRFVERFEWVIVILIDQKIMYEIWFMNYLIWKNDLVSVILAQNDLYTYATRKQTFTQMGSWCQLENCFGRLFEILCEHMGFAPL